MNRLEQFLTQFKESHQLQKRVSIVGFMLFVVGIKWLELKLWGSDVPFWDQWEGEGLWVLVPFGDGNLDLLSMFHAAHNEHRIGWTRLWTLVISAWNGQWDPLLICTLSAVVHAGTGAYLLHKLWPMATGPMRLCVSATVLALFTFPTTYENLTNSFQSQFYFLLAAAILHIALVCDSKPGTWRWFAGMAIGLCGLWTMASGFLAPVAVIAVRSLRALQIRRWSRGDTVTVGLCAAIVIAGSLMVGHAPSNDIFRARGVIDFFETLAHVGAFPFPNTPGLFLLVQGPLILWLIHRIRSKNHSWTPAEIFLFAFIIWLGLQTASIVYGRAHYWGAMAERYLDILGLLLAANVAALALLSRNLSPRIPNTMRTVALLWVALVPLGFLSYNKIRYANAQWMTSLWPPRIEHIQRFMATGDESAIRTPRNEEKIFPNDDGLIGLLRDKRLAPWLPSSIRSPVDFEVETADGFHKSRPAGISSEPAEYVNTWYHSSETPGLWRSAPISADGLLPILRIRFAGSTKLENNALKLTTDDGRESDLQVTGFMGNRWQRGHLFVPSNARTVRLVAESETPGNWLAFAEPVEVGWGTYIAEELRERYQYLVISGGSLLLVGLVFPVVLVPKGSSSK